MRRQGHGFKVTDASFNLYHELRHIDEWNLLYLVEDRILRVVKLDLFFRRPIGLAKKKLFSEFKQNKDGGD